MTYNLKLFWRMAMRSFFGSKGTHGRLTRKRVIFLLLFYSVWPAWTIFTWFCLLLDDLLFPGYKKQVIEKPLFIIGNFRSGSTFLHRLLSRETETFTSLRTWDIFITPSITQRKIAGFFAAFDRLFDSPLKRFLVNFDRRTLGKIKIHRISLFEPEEDENILLHAWSTFFSIVMFPFTDEMPPYPFFDDALPVGERRRIMGFYHSLIQRHIYADGAKRHFVSKNPAFSAKIETLLEFFPDARVLYLVRNPLDMLPSTVSWLSYATSVFCTPREKYIFIEETLAFTQYWYRHPLHYIDTHPSPNFQILSYDDLIERPREMISGFYRQFGYPEYPSLGRIVAQAVTETQTYRSDHEYSYERMGFTRSQIVAAYQDIFDRFGFDTGKPLTQAAKITLEPPIPVPGD